MWLSLTTERTTQIPAMPAVMNMLQLTDNQEITLNRWASFNLGRPWGGFMAFLMGETGLQQEQIDHWWTNQENTRK